MRQLNYKIVDWPAKGEFRIARSALTHFKVVQVEIRQNGVMGRAECRPYARYDETAGSVIAEIEAVRDQIEKGLSNEDLQGIMKAGAARNAVDCALWDLNCKAENRPIWDILRLDPPRPRVTAYTLSLNTAEVMARAAIEASEYSLLKIKLGPDNPIEACQAILEARPDASLIIDANEAMTQSQFEQLIALPAARQIAMIEQPFPASQDKSGLFSGVTEVLICADESLHTSADLERIWNTGYRAINVKLDKTGGLNEALRTMQIAKDMGFVIMAGCMVGSSLAMAPMAILESYANFIDLDGPLLLSEDVENAIKYDGETMIPPSRELWG